MRHRAVSTVGPRGAAGEGKSLEYVEKPFVLRQKYYNERSLTDRGYFEDAGSAIVEFNRRRATSLRDWIQVVDLRTGTVIADTRSR